jgi:hypothetical protein
LAPNTPSGTSNRNRHKQIEKTSAVNRKTPYATLCKHRTPEHSWKIHETAIAVGPLPLQPLPGLCFDLVTKEIQNKPLFAEIKETSCSSNADEERKAFKCQTYPGNTSAGGQETTNRQTGKLSKRNGNFEKFH